MTAENGGAAAQLLRFLAERGKDISPLLILTHNHPDPDCMASACALAYLAQRLHAIQCRVAYGGIIGRVENQVMAKTLRLPLKPLRDSDFKRYPHVALLDTQPPFHNNPFPGRRKATLVVDHHPRHRWTHAECACIDEEAGATATILSETLTRAGLDIPARLATALAYGISSETENLGRDAGPRDVSAYLALIQKSSTKALSRIQNPPRPRAFFQILGRAIQNAFVLGSTIGVHLGEVPTPDRVAQMADFLLTHEKMRWSFCTGRFAGRLHVSLRSRNPKARAGRLLRALLGPDAAGGHGMIAGGAVPMEAGSREEEWQSREQALSLDFLKALGYREPIELQFPFRA